MKRVTGAAPRGADGQPGIDEIVQTIEERLIKKMPMTPEQGCLGCGLGIGLLVVSLLVWLGIFWYYNPEFHVQARRTPILINSRPISKAKLP